MDIGEVAERTGLAASALRFYEKKGLIRPAGRRGLRRQYDAAVVERLAMITLARAAGFTLEEIGRLLAARGPAGLDRAALSAKAEELDRRMRQLKAMRDGLRHAAACSAPSHFECPKFRRLMRAALAGAFKISAGA